jgi:anaerobic selenocysteine-containing dehydrogenase
VPPQHEAWPDIKIVFELAKRLGYEKNSGTEILNRFQRDASAAQRDRGRLAASPGNSASAAGPRYRKYREDNQTGKPKSRHADGKTRNLLGDLKTLGYDPLPYWREPAPGPMLHPNCLRSFH